MNSGKVIAELEAKYPGKTIIKNNEENPTEIICEIEPTSDHPEYSIAIAVIDESIPHTHECTTEKYTVLKGHLQLVVNNNVQEIYESTSYTVTPHTSHYALGNETWVQVYSTPGWTSTDHIVV